MVLLEMIEVRKRNTGEARDFGREGLKEINSSSPCFIKEASKPAALLK